MRRGPALPVLLVGVLLSACGVPEIPYPDEEAVADSQLVTIAGVTFERPELTWRLLDAHWLEPKNAVHVRAPEMARSLGLTRGRFARLMDEIDLYVVEDERNDRGVFDVVTVDDTGHELRGDAELEGDLRSMGAHRLVVDQVATAVGSATVVTYTVGRGERRVFGRTAVLDVDGELDIAVAASTPGRARRLLDGVLDSLAAG